MYNRKIGLWLGGTFVFWGLHQCKELNGVYRSCQLLLAPIDSTITNTCCDICPCISWKGTFFFLIGCIGILQGLSWEIKTLEDTRLFGCRLQMKGGIWSGQKWEGMNCLIVKHFCILFISEKNFTCIWFSSLGPLGCIPIIGMGYMERSLCIEGLCKNSAPSNYS